MQTRPRGGSATSKRRARIFRGFVGVGVAALGIMNIASALTPPLHERFRLLRSLPLIVSHTANAITVVAGVALILLSRQIGRGKRRAWVLALLITGASAISHIFKGLDVEEAAVAGSLFIALVFSHREFRASGDPATLSRLRVVLPALIVIDFSYGLAGIYLRHLAPSGFEGFTEALEEVALRLIGLVGSVTFHGHRFGVWFPASMTVLGMFSLAVIAWDIFRPVLARTSSPEDEERARSIVTRFGVGSLDYFLLRDDKSRFAYSDCIIGYRIVGGIAVASGDPVGPAHEWPATQQAFLDFTVDHGWGIACIGSCEVATETWRDLGLRAIYIGDEAHIDVAGFSLEGRKIRKVRQAIAHIERKGYTAEWWRTGDLTPDLKMALLHVSNRWKAGDIERGFSMNLGRLFDPRDPDCLVAIGRDATGEAKGFVHFVPIASRGFSLDVMRKDRATPSALNDFLIAKTLLFLKDKDYEEVSLNFAFLAELFDRPESVDSTWKRFERWIAMRLGPWFQIESLYRFNDKFIPNWRQRYVCFEDPLSVPAVALAALRAEKLLDLDLFKRGQGGRRLAKGKGAEADAEV
ncbi:MAG: phosphatidylglycerol lysyltransferase domain-containing protein [Actinobacteria bacterium]|nr:phosphatidylglycerol lysyltransferase domain-containing protein [Actinomycetota bacterium]